MLGRSFFGKIAVYILLVMGVVFTGMFFAIRHFSVSKDVIYVMENGIPKPVVRCRVFSFTGSVVRAATTAPDGSKTCE